MYHSMFNFYCLMPTFRGLSAESSGAKQSLDSADKPWDVGALKNLTWRCISHFRF